MHFFSVEQVKGSEEMKEKIIAASKDARSLPDYPQELLPDYFTNSVTICDKYLNNYQESHLHTNGMVMLNISLVSYKTLLWMVRVRYCLTVKTEVCSKWMYQIYQKRQY
jgi:hypothetical protein